MRFSTYQPWAPVRRMHRDFERMLDNNHQNQADGASEVTWRPSVDISENDERWLLAAEIPGVDPKDINITAEDGLLVIEGEKSPVIDANDNLHRTERITGRFYRRFTLPQGADVQKITANSKNGVLSLSIPKQADKQPQRIQIESE
ncbi:MAG: Hsp20/alpha crystallin family protein [Gammaproteobacteria bacterium]|nr:Hsp20/alpha crystallin family protein [Gammaproteobacteria bacterium]